MNFEIIDYEELKFDHPFTMLVSGPTKAGKTVWVGEFLKHGNHLINKHPEKIYWFYSEWQPLYTDIAQYVPNIQFMEGLSNLSMLKNDKDLNKIAVFDDLMSEGVKNQSLTDLFTRGSHHWNLSCIFIVQNLYFGGLRTARLNTHYLVLFQSPDKQQINCFAKQMYPGKTKILTDAYTDAVKNKFTPLVVDMTNSCAERLRLRTNILPSQTTIIYEPKL